MSHSMAQPTAPRERRLPLRGAVNFRDLGGYPAADGRRLKWGLLFRADSLAELSDEDLPLVQALGLRQLFDLRHESERQQRPNRLPAGPLPRTHAIGFHPQGTEALMQGLRAHSLSAADAHELLLNLYRRLPLDHTDSYRRLLHGVAGAEGLPALVHCTSGKDRTGFAAAVLLMALGVPRELIAADYALSNQQRRDLRFMVGATADPAVLAVAQAADPRWLQAAFEVIDTHWGGSAAFLQRGLGFSEADQARWRDLMLEG